MRTVAGHLVNLTRVVLAGEISTRREMQGLDPRSPQALEIASEWIYRAQDGGWFKHDVNDALVIAETVWWTYMRPHITKMLVDKWGADEAEAAKVVDSYFVDDSPQYDPSRRRGRG